MPVVITLPWITALYAGLLGLLGVALTAYVIVHRVKLKVGAGDGGHPKMAQVIRAHGNFAEQVPLALLLMALTELLGARAWLMHVLGVALVIGRLIHAFGLSRTLGVSMGRQNGTAITLTVTAVASLSLLYAVVTH
jgi:uncharacterized protein